MKLLEKTKVGSVGLANRVVMAPMTRNRATTEGLVTKSMITYYEQRAGMGLIITEGVNISRQAIGSANTPGIYTEQQTESWKMVTEAVHKKGGKIFLQLWHTGRSSHSSLQQNGDLPVSASAVRIEEHKIPTPSGMQAYELPRALETKEVKDVVKQYGTAAENAKHAGFDGVELHGAFGYLPNQFLVDGVNKRRDKYGGSIENRSRFVLEIMQVLITVWGPGKAGIKLSPSIPFNGMIDSDPKALFTYLIKELNKMPLAYLHLMGPLFPLTEFPDWPSDVIGTYGSLFDKTVIANGGYTRDTAEKLIENGKAQLVSFASLALANPDLVKRFELHASLNKPDRNTYYSGGDKGYIDYPTLNQSLAPREQEPTLK